MLPEPVLQYIPLSYTIIYQYIPFSYTTAKHESKLRIINFNNIADEILYDLLYDL